MALRDFGTSLRYRFAKETPQLGRAVRRGDAAMAAFILNRHADEVALNDLEQGLIWSGQTEDAENEPLWRDVVRQIRLHPAAGGVSPSVVADALRSAACWHDEGMAAELLLFPQVGMMTDVEWDSVLFECLPAGDPEKRRIEKRGFVDQEGHAGILAMVRQAMAGRAARGPAEPTGPRP